MKQRKLNRWFYGAMMIFTVGGATGCLYSAAAAAVLIGWSVVVSRREHMAPRHTAGTAMADRFGIAAQRWDGGDDRGGTIEPTSLVVSAAA